MNEEQYHKDFGVSAPATEEWDRQYDHGVAPLPWTIAADGIRDALGRRIFISCLSSNTRGYISANYDIAAAVVARMNCTEMTLNQLQDSIVEWADDVFPNRNPQSGFLKMYEELGEVLREPSNRHEWADVFIMLLDIAKTHGVDNLTTAIQEKMEINRGRKWGENVLGVMQHVSITKTTITILNGPHTGEMEIVVDSQLPDRISMADDESGCMFMYIRVIGGDVDNAYMLDEVTQ